jgi:hypothetical protein
MCYVTGMAFTEYINTAWGNIGNQNRNNLPETPVAFATNCTYPGSTGAADGETFGNHHPQRERSVYRQTTEVG